MPIKFVSLDKEFCDKIRIYGYEALNIPIEYYIPTKKTYYVSPANSLCFMCGGIDKPLSQIVFPNIETHVRQLVEYYGKNYFTWT